MPKYFTHLNSSNAPANALQREALAALKANSNLLIDDVETFVDVIKRTIDGLNAAHPRCSSLRVSTTNFTGTINLYFGDRFTVNFSIYPVKNGGQNA